MGGVENYLQIEIHCFRRLFLKRTFKTLIIKSVVGERNTLLLFHKEKNCAKKKD